MIKAQQCHGIGDLTFAGLPDTLTDVCILSSDSKEIRYVSLRVIDFYNLRGQLEIINKSLTSLSLLLSGLVRFLTKRNIANKLLIGPSIFFQTE